MRTAIALSILLAACVIHDDSSDECDSNARCAFNDNNKSSEFTRADFGSVLDAAIPVDPGNQTNDTTWTHMDCSVAAADCMQAACDAGYCGGESRYDENMCPRVECSEDGDCMKGETCVEVLAARVLCGGNEDGGMCGCGNQLIGGTILVCIEETK